MNIRPLARALLALALLEHLGIFVYLCSIPPSPNDCMAEGIKVFILMVCAVIGFLNLASGLVFYRLLRRALADTDVALACTSAAMGAALALPFWITSFIDDAIPAALLAFPYCYLLVGTLAARRTYPRLSTALAFGLLIWTTLVIVRWTPYWAARDAGTRANLRGAVLPGANLRGADLRSANLQKSGVHP